MPYSEDADSTIAWVKIESTKPSHFVEGALESSDLGGTLYIESLPQLLPSVHSWANRSRITRAIRVRRIKSTRYPRRKLIYRQLDAAEANKDTAGLINRSANGSSLLSSPVETALHELDERLAGLVRSILV